MSTVEGKRAARRLRLEKPKPLRFESTDCRLNNNIGPQGSVFCDSETIPTLVTNPGHERSKQQPITTSHKQVTSSSTTSPDTVGLSKEQGHKLYRTLSLPRKRSTDLDCFTTACDLNNNENSNNNNSVVNSSNNNIHIFGSGSSICSENDGNNNALLAGLQRLDFSSTAKAFNTMYGNSSNNNNVDSSCDMNNGNFMTYRDMRIDSSEASSCSVTIETLSPLDSADSLTNKHFVWDSDKDQSAESANMSVSPVSSLSGNAECGVAKVVNCSRNGNSQSYQKLVGNSKTSVRTADEAAMTRCVVQVIRQPLSATSERAEIWAVEENAPSGMYTARGRRKMFSFHQQANQDTPEPFRLITYSTRKLVELGSSPYCKVPPAGWEEMASEFPDVCLMKMEPKVAYNRSISDSIYSSKSKRSTKDSSVVINWTRGPSQPEGADSTKDRQANQEDRGHGFGVMRSTSVPCGNIGTSQTTLHSDGSDSLSWMADLTKPGRTDLNSASQNQSGIHKSKSQQSIAENPIDSLFGELSKNSVSSVANSMLNPIFGGGKALSSNDSVNTNNAGQMETDGPVNMLFGAPLPLDPSASDFMSANTEPVPQIFGQQQSMFGAPISLSAQGNEANQAQGQLGAQISSKSTMESCFARTEDPEAIFKLPQSCFTSRNEAGRSQAHNTGNKALVKPATFNYTSPVQSSAKKVKTDAGAGYSFQLDSLADAHQSNQEPVTFNMNLPQSFNFSSNGTSTSGRRENTDIQRQRAWNVGRSLQSDTSMKFSNTKDVKSTGNVESKFDNASRGRVNVGYKLFENATGQIVSERRQESATPKRYRGTIRSQAQSQAESSRNQSRATMFGERGHQNSQPLPSEEFRYKRKRNCDLDAVVLNKDILPEKCFW